MPASSRSSSRRQIEREVAQIVRPSQHSPRSLPVLEREAWPDGTEVVWLASPLPFERKPVVPAHLLQRFRVELVDLASLVGTQRRVTSGGLEKYAAPPTREPTNPEDLPLVLRADGGKSYVSDGHHRLVAAYLRGDTHARARVVEIGALDR